MYLSTALEVGAGDVVEYSSHCLVLPGPVRMTSTGEEAVLEDGAWQGEENWTGRDLT